MQLLQPIKAGAEILQKEQSAGVHLPYVRHIDAYTLVTRQGYLLQTIQLDGFLFETADSDELNYRNQLREMLLRSLGNSRISLYHHLIRTRVEEALDFDYPDNFSRQIDARWKAKLASRHLYANRLYITILQRPQALSNGIIGKVLGTLWQNAETRQEMLTADLQSLGAVSETLMSSLAAYRPRLLSAYSHEFGIGSEQMRFLGELYNGSSHPYLVPEGNIGHSLPARRLSFGAKCFERAETGLEEKQFGTIVSIKNYPASTQAGMFDTIFRLPFALNFAQSFSYAERGKALGSMNLALRRMRSTEDGAISLREELHRAIDDVAAGKAGFGEHNASFTLTAASQEELENTVAEVIAALADIGIVGVREDIALEPAFWAQFPGNIKYSPRPALVSTQNFASLASLHNFPKGKPRGNHWGEAVTLFETTASGPYFFNFHQNDQGNFTIIGPTGSGKTVVLNFLLAQSLKYNPNIVFFDKDRGGELFVRSVGGQYDRLRPGHASGLNPLMMDDTPTNRNFLIEWLSMLAGGVSTEEAAIIRRAVEANFTAPPAFRRLSRITELYRGQHRPTSDDLWSRMRPWVEDGEWAWLFDNAEDHTDLSQKIIGFDITAILDEPHLRTPALFYLFHRVEERLDGSPAIIVVDEGWKALDDEVFVRRIKDWEKTIRKRNGIVGFATQSASDALESKIASAIIEQAATQIFMINPKARASDYISGFGLTEHEFHLIRSLPQSSHCFLVKHGAESVIVRLNLKGEAEILTILSGREESVRIFDSLCDEEGHAPADWLAKLLARCAHD